MHMHMHAFMCMHVCVCSYMHACAWLQSSLLSKVPVSPVVGSSRGREIEGCCYNKWLVTSQVISPALQPHIILAHDWKERKFLTTESHFLVCTAALAPTLSFNTLVGL